MLGLAQMLRRKESAVGRGESSLLCKTSVSVWHKYL